MTIKVLDKQVADKIAAGEVIERPLSIVKELVENSIDAGADSITVEIKNGGKSYIRVTDNGCGIDPDQVETAFLRHATSKIETAKDLDSIVTLGFRGEALASISAVTRTEITTKTRDQAAGKQVIVHGSNVVSSSSTGCPDGTTIVVEDLFYNTPAREKFLKSSGVEAGRIIDFMSQIALTRTDIKFRLINNGKNVFSTGGRGDLLNTVLEVFKEKDYKNLVPVNYEENGIRVYGLISKPSFTRTSRRSQYFFVNGRVINSKVIERGLMEGYRERLFEGRYPIAFLFLEIPTESLDVNIHPNKREVRFDNENLIVEIIGKAVVTTLTSNIGVEAADIEKAAEKLKQIEEPDFQIFQKTETKKEESSTSQKPFSAPADKIKEDNTFKSYEKVEQVDINNILSTKRKEAEEKSKVEEGNLDTLEPKLKPFDFSQLQFRDILFGTYIIASDDSSMYLIDQHAAHERIFYEKLVGRYLSGEKNGQILMVPFTVDISPELTEDQTWMEVLDKMGYSIEEFGDATAIVREIPEFMSLAEAEDFVDEFIDSYMDGVTMNNRVVIDKLITKSCKSAIKAHDYIDPEEARSLIDQMKQCRNPFSCPHGRPTFIRFSQYELERMFKRT